MQRWHRWLPIVMIGLQTTGCALPFTDCRIDLELADPRGVRPEQIETTVEPRIDGEPHGEPLHFRGKHVQFPRHERETYQITCRAPNHVPYQTAVEWQPSTEDAKRNSGLILLAGFLAVPGAALGGIVDLFTGLTGAGLWTGFLLTAVPIYTMCFDAIGKIHRGDHKGDTHLHVTLQNAGLSDWLRIHSAPLHPSRSDGQ